MAKRHHHRSYGTNSAAYAINDAGQIVGDLLIADGSTRGFIWQNGVITDLGTLGGSFSNARGISATGEVTGWSFPAVGDHRAYLWKNGTMTDVGTLGGNRSRGSAVTGVPGVVVGQAETVAGTNHAFVFTLDAAGNVTSRTDLGSLGADSIADDTNASGQMIGHSWFSGFTNYHAVMWNGGALMDLGTLGGANSFAAHLNDLGLVVGNSETGAGLRAFLYTAGTMKDINTMIPAGSGLTLQQAQEINNSSQIACIGLLDGSTATRAFLLTPASATYNICPLYDQTKAVRRGSTIPIKLELCDSTGLNLSSPSVVITATALTRLSDNAPGTLQDSGNANPDNNFRYDATLGGSGGYIFNLSTGGLPSGTYRVSFTAGSDPAMHAVEFQVK